MRILADVLAVYLVIIAPVTAGAIEKKMDLERNRDVVGAFEHSSSDHYLKTPKVGKV
jgi:hypothetical protein